VVNRRLRIQANIEAILTGSHDYQSLVGNNGMASTKKIRIQVWLELSELNLHQLVVCTEHIVMCTDDFRDPGNTLFLLCWEIRKWLDAVVPLVQVDFS